jgi:hypothetical protein
MPEMIKKYGDGGSVSFRLAVLQKNPYLIAALHTYSQLGFQVEKRPFPVSVYLEDYFTMRIKVSNHEGKRTVQKQKLANNLIRVAALSKYTHNDLMNLLEAVIYRSPKIRFNKKHINKTVNLRRVWEILNTYL